MKKNGGFEGNAQTLRILSRVEKKVFVPNTADDHCAIAADGTDNRLGLNLTYRSLASVLKYDKKIPLRRAKAESLCKGYYASEASVVGEIKRNVGGTSGANQFKTIECQIMDIADDIAYSTYDLEDAMKGGFTHPLQLLSKVFGDKDLFEKLFKKVAKEIDGLQERDVYAAVQSLWATGATIFKPL